MFEGVYKDPTMDSEVLRDPRVSDVAYVTKFQENGRTYFKFRYAHWGMDDYDTYTERDIERRLTGLTRFNNPPESDDLED